MDRIDLVIKGTVVVVTSIVAWLVGSFGIVFTVLLGLMFIDFVTGVMAGSSNEGLNSTKGIKGLIKKVYIVLLIGATYMIEIAVLQSNGIITSGISGAFAFMEFVSIVENGGRMGVKLPKKVKSLITVLKNKEDADNTKSPD